MLKSVWRLVKPASTEEVAAVMKLCAKTHTAVAPQGGYTGPCGGATPPATEDASRFVPGGTQIVLKLSRLNRVRAVDAVNNTITVEGLWQQKRGEILRYKSPLEMDLMRRIKATLEPQGIMNLGNVL